MKYRLLFMAYWYASFLSGQTFNHLPNPGFEGFTICPDTNQFDGYVNNWSSTLQLGSAGETAGWYYNSCDRNTPISPFRNILGNGGVRVLAGTRTGANIHMPGFIFVALERPLIKDSLYYFEYTSASNRWLVDDSNFPNLPSDNWCISPDRGFTFTTGLPDPDTASTADRLTPHSLAIDFGQSQNEGGTIRLGQCFRATGKEVYFVFGQFYGPSDDLYCLGNQHNGQHLQFSEILDNFKLKSFEPKLCCDIEVCEKEPINFVSSFNEYVLPDAEYIWNDGVTDLERTFDQTGYYSLEIRVECGAKRTNRIFVNLIDCTNNFMIANVFSPNGDGVNDLLTLQWKELFNLLAFEFSIYDRWGNEVYSSNALDGVGWGGYYRGEAAMSGVYIWYLSYSVQEGEVVRQKVESGDVLLIR